MFLTENNKPEMWKQMLKENFNVQDAYTLDWVSKYATTHAIKESNLGVNNFGGEQGFVPGGNGVAPMYATPLNTPGMGQVMAPSQISPNSTAPGDFFTQKAGSGDIPVSTLPMALNIALFTVGLELVPVIPAKGPWHLLTYMDFPYAGGKLGKKNEIANFDGVGAGRENKPLYFKVLLPGEQIAILRGSKALVEGAKVDFLTDNKKYEIKGIFKGFGRMDGGLLLETVSCMKGEDNVSLAEAFAYAKVKCQLRVDGKAIKDILGEDSDAFKNLDLTGATVDFVQTSVDLIDGFANFATGKKEGMTRAQNETGTGNKLGLRIFSKWVAMQSYEVTASVTRQQLQDLPLYGVDAVSQIMEACQNEITQHINQRITNHVRQLGVTNAVKIRNNQGYDFNLWMGTKDAESLADFGITDYTDIFGVNYLDKWGKVKNSEVSSSGENNMTRQRRVMSRILQAANALQVTGRRGRPTWILTNATVASILQDCSGFVIAPMANNLTQDGSQNLFLNGTLAGLKIYVDPYMDLNDNRITLGRKGNGNEPGVIFMPYILADTISVTSEGTMAPTLLVNSRFGIVDAGFYPEAQYLTFAIGSEFGLI